LSTFRIFKLQKKDKTEVEFAAEIARRVRVATLYQCGTTQAEIMRITGESRGFVRQWKDQTEFHRKPGSGRKKTALTSDNLKKLGACRGKSNQSVRKVAARLGISKSSVSFGFLHELGLPALRRPKASRLKRCHIIWRFQCAKRMRHLTVEEWEKFLISDEKIWTVNGLINPQNDRTRARSSSEVSPRELEKFCGQRMCWLGMSARGLTPLVWIKGNLNGEIYQDKILRKIVLEDVMQRGDENGPINRRKLFEDNDSFIFEQDFASCHSTNVNEDFMEQNFPAHTPTLHRFREKHPWYFPPKMDDFWVIERLWAILAAKVYRNPRPTHVDALMRRVRDAVRETKPETLTKLVHEMPARMNKIFEMKGRKIPASWKARKC